MTKRSILKTEGKLSHAIHVETDGVNAQKFNIPVIDVRDGDKAREAVKKVEKYANITRGNRYFKQSFSLYGYSYNMSMKCVSKEPI